MAAARNVRLGEDKRQAGRLPNIRADVYSSEIMGGARKRNSQRNRVTVPTGEQLLRRGGGTGNQSPPLRVFDLPPDEIRLFLKSFIDFVKSRPSTLRAQDPALREGGAKGAVPEVKSRNMSTINVSIQPFQSPVPLSRGASQSLGRPSSRKRL